jgi:alginate O-acetyltransferase complex protein AlgI
MLFNSLSFAVFLPLIFLLYWLVCNKKLRLQNLFLLVISYVFYSFWDWRFIFLLAFSTLLDYYSGLKIEESKKKSYARFWLIVSIGINLAFLAFFKYYDFFITELGVLLNSIGLKVHPWTLKIILPVGISFYTFHGLSYIIDVYKKRINAERNYVDYAVFVSYFPLLVAGPIERATHLLPQLKKSRMFNYEQATSGMKQMLWGFFKKIVIADNCAEYANLIFNHHDDYYGSTLILGAIFFTFQIYGDFSGYSDIALGVSKLFGIELLRNFSNPYFSRDIAEFWRRWHISLSSWFKDYLYIPLGGSKGSIGKRLRNTFIIFIVSGLWHGANWTFIVWGLLNAIYFIPLLLSGKNRENLDVVAEGRLLPSIGDTLKMLFTFMLTVFAWIFFRSTDLTHAIEYCSGFMNGSIFLVPQEKPLYLFVLISIFFIIEWIGRTSNFAISLIGINWPKPVRWSFYYMLVLSILFYGGKDQNFIYFQF